MSKRLAVVVIHGMGSHKNEQENKIHLYAKPMIDELGNRIKKVTIQRKYFKI